MEKYVERIVDELFELEVKLEKLEKFIASEGYYQEVSSEDVNDLEEQALAMKLYEKILERRCYRKGITHRFYQEYKLKKLEISK